MTPEEYQLSVAEAWRAAIPMVATVGWIVLAAAGAVGALFLLSRTPTDVLPRSADALVRGLSQAGAVVGLWASGLRVGGPLRWVASRRATAFLVACVSVALGLYAAASRGRCEVAWSLGGRGRRERRFPHQTPAEVAAVLAGWAAPPPGKKRLVRTP